MWWKRLLALQLILITGGAIALRQLGNDTLPPDELEVYRSRLKGQEEPTEKLEEMKRSKQEYLDKFRRGGGGGGV